MQLTITVEQENGHFVAHLLERPEYRAEAPSRRAALEALGRSLGPMLDQEDQAMDEVQDKSKPRPVFIKLPARNIRELFGIFKDDPDLDQIREDLSTTRRGTQERVWRMTALDSDLFTLYLQGHPVIAAKLDTISLDELVLPVVVVEEVMRGRLNSIRQAQTRRKIEHLTDAYVRFSHSIEAAAHFPILNYTMDAEKLLQLWRSQKINIGTQDLRIGAICVSQNIKLATRNRHDFERVPGLTLELWI